MKTLPSPSAFCSRPRVTLLIAAVASLVCATAALADPGNGKGNGKGKEHGNGTGKSADFIPPGHRRAPVEVIVVQAPPPLRVEVVSVRPSAAHVLVTGYWIWESSAYVWAPGVWVLPPEPAAVWVAPRYEERSGVHISISGFWKI